MNVLGELKTQKDGRQCRNQPQEEPSHPRDKVRAVLAEHRTELDSPWNLLAEEPEK